MKGASAEGGECMATIQPKGENLRQAIKWISEERMEDAGRPIQRLISEAGQRYNLSPKDAAFLVSFYKENKD